MTVFLSKNFKVRAAEVGFVSESQATGLTINNPPQTGRYSITVLTIDKLAISRVVKRKIHEYSTQLRTGANEE